MKKTKKRLTEDELRRCILEDLANRKPWNKIAKQYHVSAKTINKYRKESASVSMEKRLNDDDWRLLYNLQGVLGTKTITSAISEAFDLCLQVTPYVKIYGVQHSEEVIPYLLHQHEAASTQLLEFKTLLGEDFIESVSCYHLESLHRFLMRMGYSSSIGMLIDELVAFYMQTKNLWFKTDY